MTEEIMEEDEQDSDDEIIIENKPDIEFQDKTDVKQTETKLAIEQEIKEIQDEEESEEDDKSEPDDFEEQPKKPYVEQSEHKQQYISTPDSLLQYEVYKQAMHKNYQDVEVILYSYQVPSFATAMTDGSKIWFGPRMEFYDPHPNDRLYHELSHWNIKSPYGTELDVETMAQLQLPAKYNTLVNISYKV